jgi:hypothetical protein
MTKAPKNAIVHDDENITVKVIDSGVEDQPESSNSSVHVGVTHVECIKAIVQCEETIKFQRETIAGLKKKLVEDMGVDAGFVAELINVVKKEMDPEHGGDVINKKTKVLDAAEQVVVLYPNVVVRPGTLTGITDDDGAGSSVKPLV